MSRARARGARCHCQAQREAECDGRSNRMPDDRSSLRPPVTQPADCSTTLELTQRLMTERRERLLEVVAILEVLDEPGMCRLPAQ
jgi:hypothetical protein